MKSLLLLNSGFALIVLIGLSPILSAQANAQNIVISPDCGPQSGFEINFNVNGFEANSNVYWVIMHQNTDTVSSMGYYKTNSTGGFNEDTFTEDELLKGNHDVIFFDDKDKNAKVDKGKEEHKTTLLIPCT